VREFIEKAFAYLGIQLEWEGEKTEECGIDKATGKTLVQVNPKYYRPIDIDSVLGDASKAHKTLDWQPEVKFDRLVELMMEADLAAIPKK
jgi:GDPmannose 4,6-dehydratase